MTIMNRNTLIGLAAMVFFALWAVSTVADDDFTQARLEMVEQQIAARGVGDERVLQAMRSVPRHEFVPKLLKRRAYHDKPLRIGHKQTISQPYIVALMTELAQVKETDRVLEIGTGSGYQAAVLAELTDEVYTIEYIEPLGLQAKKLLKRLGYENVSVKIGDGYLGWPEHQPFDAIIVTAAPDHVPEPLIEQLKPGGRLVIPVEKKKQRDMQFLTLLKKNEQGKLEEHRVLPVRFVPFLGPNAN